MQRAGPPAGFPPAHSVPSLPIGDGAGRVIYAGVDICSDARTMKEKQRPRPFGNSHTPPTAGCRLARMYGGLKNNADKDVQPVVVTLQLFMGR